MTAATGNGAAGIELPQPEKAAREHSGLLADAIAERIDAAGGAICFDEYMRMALYEPGLGYYAGPAVEFGAQGDFVTAPEISPLFGRCLARQVGELLEQGCAARILEFGAGSGKLCADLLDALPRLESYLIVDLGGALKQRQQALLRARLPAEQFARIEWLAEWPTAFDGIAIANEVLDAMPVKRVVRRERWRELGVGIGSGRFEWREFDADANTTAAMDAIESRLGVFAEGYTSELNPNFAPWFRALADSCAAAAVLIVDYGYERAQFYHPERSDGTLSCHYRHRVHFDPLLYPGLQDITAFVDFDAAADAAEAAGFEILGLVTQGHFLLANGLLDEAQQASAAADQLQLLKIAQQVKMLTLPQEMGEKFKVLALARDRLLQMPAMNREAALG